MTESKGFRGELAFGLLAGLLGGLAGQHEGQAGIVIGGFSFSLVGGALYRIVSNFIDGLSSHALDQRPLTAAQPGSWQATRHHVPVGLLVGLSGGSCFGLLVGLVSGLRAGLLTGLRWGLMTGLVFGLSLGLVFGRRTLAKRDVTSTVALLAQSGKDIWHRAARSNLLRGALASGLVCGLTFGLQDSVRNVLYPGGSLLSGLTIGLDTSLYAGLFCAVSFVFCHQFISGLSSKMVSEQTLVTPNQGIRRSAQNSALVLLMCGMLFSLLFSLLSALLVWPYHATDWLGVLRGDLADGLLFGTLGGLVLGLLNGGLACIEQSVLRLLLWLDRSLPWQYRRFLDYATERVFLRRVGGGYIFIHRLLLDYFASLTTTLAAQIEGHARATQWERCDCGYQNDHARATFCPQCGKRKSGSMQTLSSAPTREQTNGERRP